MIPIPFSRAAGIAVAALGMLVLAGWALEEIAGDETLRHLPVVILTTSESEQEILKMYKLRCSSYIVKPIDLEQFWRVIRSLSDYWFTVVVLPRSGFNGKAG